MADLLNSIPVVGHVKGVYNYATGNPKAGHKAMYEATRSTAVIGGGAIGSLSGPVGAAVGAAACGALTDSVTSLITDKPQGYIRRVTDMASDVRYDKPVLKSAARTGLTLGCDIVDGLGAGKVVQKVTETAGRSACKEIGKELVKREARSAGKRALSRGKPHYDE